MDVFLERFLKTLKDFVRLRAKPEASMAEGWIVQEAFVYVSLYLHTIDPTLPRLWREEEDPKKHSHVPIEKGLFWSWIGIIKPKSITIVC